MISYQYIDRWLSRGIQHATRCLRWSWLIFRGFMKLILFLIQNLQYYTATLYFIPGLFIPSLLYLVYACGAALKYTKSPCTYLTRYLGLRQVVNHNNSNTFIQRRSLFGKNWTQLILLLGQSIISNHLMSSFFQVQIISEVQLQRSGYFFAPNSK